MPKVTGHRNFNGTDSHFKDLRSAQYLIVKWWAYENAKKVPYSNTCDFR